MRSIANRFGSRIAAGLFVALLLGAATAAGAAVELPCPVAPEDPGAVEAVAFAAVADGFLVADLAAGRVAACDAAGAAAGERIVPGLLALAADGAGGALLLVRGTVERHASRADLVAGRPGRTTPLAGFAPDADPARYRIAAAPDGALFLHDRVAGMHRIFSPAGRAVAEFPGDGPVLPLTGGRCLDAPCDPDAGLLVSELIPPVDPATAEDEPETFHLSLGRDDAHGAVAVAFDAARGVAWLLVPTGAGAAEPAVELLRADRSGARRVALLPFGPLPGFHTVLGGTLFIAAPAPADGPNRAILRVTAVPLGR